MELPKGKLTALSEKKLKGLLAAARRSLCEVEQELIADFYSEEQGEKHLPEEDQDPADKDKQRTEEKENNATADNNTTLPSSGGENEKEKEKDLLAVNPKRKLPDASSSKASKSVKPSASSSPSLSSDSSPDPKCTCKSSYCPSCSEDDGLMWQPPKRSIPVRADVRTFDFNKLVNAQRRATGRLFDVIMTDPPWQLATSNPTRGVAIGYQQLSDNLIEQIPFPTLQENGLLFVWVINAKYKFALELMEKWGYTLVDEITWVKRTVNRRLAKSHGFYLQHAKETCLVGRKGQDPPGMVGNIESDIIWSERRGQSQKPVEIYELIEKLIPNGNYLEIFARRNNLRDGWVSIGNEL